MPMQNKEARRRFERELRTVRDSAENTIQAYLRALDGLGSFLSKRGVKLTQAPRNEVLAWRESLDDKSPSTIKIAVCAARSFYDFMVDEGVIQTSPVPSKLRVKVKRRDPDGVPTVEQFLELRKNLERPIKWKGAMPVDTRRAIVELLAGTGLRIDAALTMPSCLLRLDGDNPHVYVNPDMMSCKGKTAGEVPMSPYAARILREYMANRPITDKPLFPYTATGFRGVLKKVSPDGVTVKPHSLRHFYVSMVYFRNFEGGRYDVRWSRDAAGHSNISVTDGYLKLAKRICPSDELWEAWADGKPAEERRATA